MEEEAGEAPGVRGPNCHCWLKDGERPWPTEHEWLLEGRNDPKETAEKEAGTSFRDHMGLNSNTLCK